MKLLFDEDLVEAVVFLCASGKRKGAPSLQIRRFHAEREKLYAILDPDERNSAFFDLHLEWFREWKIEQFLREATRPFPLLNSALSALAFRKARARTDEGAELFVNAEREQNAVVAIRPGKFESDEALRCFLNHELMHTSDMVDPAFGYSPDLGLTSTVRANERLVRERYRLLWDITIDGRLSCRALPAEASRERRWSEFDRAFAFWPEHKRQATFHSLGVAQPRHSDILALASDPRDLHGAQEALPGAPCPLCGFSTFDWSNASALVPQVIAAVRADFPSWTPAHGACARCADVYRAASKLAQKTDPYLV
jgi:hypothetical protein